MIFSESVQVQQLKVEEKVSRRYEYEMKVKFDYSFDFQKNSDTFLPGNDYNDLELIVCLWVVVYSSLVSRRSDIHHDDDADGYHCDAGDEMRMI